MLLQAHRKVCLSQLATLFPQPIKYESRLRNLQRFLYLPRLNVKLLWLPIIKQIVKQQFRQKGKNRAQKRHQKKLTHQGYLLLAVDRTQWRERNLFVLSLVWGNHALPVYWGCLGYVCRTTESTRQVERHSHFWIGLHGQLWVDSMADFSELMMRLVCLKPHKRLHFQQGFHALSTIQSVF